MTRTSATKLRWAVTAGLVVAIATAGALVVMSNSSNYGAGSEAGVAVSAPR